MGKNKRKKRTVKRAAELTNDSTPRSFVFHRGVVGNNIHQLITDMRHLMEPYTAINLKVTKSNVLKDFVHVAGPYGISHFITFSKTDVAPYMKICRLSRGPTLTFRIEEYSLMRDITAILKKPKTIGQQFKYPPLVVLNNFNSEALEMKLMTTIFQNMFPAIKVHKVKLSEIKRCAMFNYDKEAGVIDFRHYNIEAVPVGVNKGIKLLLKSKIPNLGTLGDISDLITGGAYLSESEGEEPNDSHVTLPQRMPGRGNIKSNQSAIKLTEMGPRLKLELIKIEEGVSCGEVLFHKYIEKTEREKKGLKKRKEEAKKLKEERRKKQESNVAKKEQSKDEHRVKCLAGMKRKVEEETTNNSGISEESGESDDEQTEENVSQTKYLKKVDTNDGVKSKLKIQGRGIKPKLKMKNKKVLSTKIKKRKLEQ